MEALQKTMAECKLWRFQDWIIFVLVTVLGIGFVHRTFIFAKIGVTISLPASFGKISFLQPKIFITEWFIAALLILAIYSVCTNKRVREIEWKQKPLLLTTLLFFIWGMLRLVLDISGNPILAIRNACFVWYLAIPFLILIIGPRFSVLNYSLFLCLVFVGGQFFTNWIEVFFGFEDRMAWAFFLGINYFVGLAFIKKLNYGIASLLFVLGSGFTFTFLGYPSRTALLSAALVIGFIAIFPNWRPSDFLKRCSIFGISIVAGFLIYHGVREVRSAGTYEITSAEYKDKLIKGESDSYGVQNFRKYLWIDAFNLFLSHPFAGIGFQKQVVYRIYEGAGEFSDNTGNRVHFVDGVKAFTHRPPISGPHNSYLNAVTRLGISGLILLFVHIVALWLLIQNNAFAAAAAMFSQMIFAFFGVALESPAYGFFSLICLAVALQVEQGKTHISDDLRRSAA